MEKEKILILGDWESIWLKKYVENVLNEDQRKIVIINDKYSISAFDVKSEIVCLPSKKSTLLSNPRLRFLVYLLETRRAVKKYGRFDFVHVHYVNRGKLLALRYLKKYSPKIISTFWGSDLLRKDNKELLTYEKYIEMSDNVTLASKELLKKFESVYGQKYAKKVLPIRFGISALSKVNYGLINRDKCREEWEIPNDKKIISIGYNGSEGQNHIPVINAIKRLPADIRKKIFLIFPLTYGLKPEYLLELEQSLKDIECGYKIFTEFMDDTETMKLRTVTDLFIHAQRTDALSASVQEYLFAKKLLLNPSWIEYQEFKKMGIYYWEYHEFDELPKLLKKYVAFGLQEDQKMRLKGNQELIAAYSSWESSSEEWKKLYTMGN